MGRPHRIHIDSTDVSTTPPRFAIPHDYTPVRQAAFANGIGFVGQHVTFGSATYVIRSLVANQHFPAMAHIHNEDLQTEIITPASGLSLKEPTTQFTLEMPTTDEDCVQAAVACIKGHMLRLSSPRSRTAFEVMGFHPVFHAAFGFPAKAREVTYALERRETERLDKFFGPKWDLIVPPSTLIVAVHFKKKKYSTFSGIDKLTCSLDVISFSEDPAKDYRQDGQERMLDQYILPNEEEE